MRFVLFPLLALALLCSVASSQSLHLGLGPGYSIMRPPEAYTVNNMDMAGIVMRAELKIADGQKSDKGYSGLARVRFRLPVLPVSILGGFTYTRIVGRCDRILATPPPWSSRAYEEGRLETEANLYSLIGGLRWDITQTKVVPYLSALLTYNRFGEMTVTVINDRWTSRAKIDGVSRTGVTVGGGVSFVLQSPLRAEIGVDYAVPNAFGRESGEKIRDAVSVSVLFSYELF